MVHCCNVIARSFAEFNPSQNEGLQLPAGSIHNYANVSVYYESDFRKNQFYGIWFRTGQFFNGSFTQSSINLNQKIQPWGAIGLTYDLNVINLPKPFSSNTIYAIGPKAQISFTKSMFLNTIIQYNSQFKNISNYVRFQWRFRPLSDLYIIYTRNYQTPPWARQHQALTAKLVYWF